MDSWKYLSEGRALCFPEDLDFPVDGDGCKSKLMGCEIKPFFENYPLVSNTQALERLDFMDLGFSDEIRKSYSMSSEPSGEVFSDEIGTDYGKVTSLFCEEKDSGSRISAHFMQSDKQDFSLVDLKLGRLADGGVAKDSEFSKASVPEPSTVLSPPAKRTHSTTSYQRSSSCQVLGCNKDLSSHKSYYKRHKVCDVHTKTAKVVVGGIEQRFCQQCSRFHLLTEFDDVKRSCRRRLAAHNKRRRKPRFTSESGSGIIDFSSSLAFPEVLPSVIDGPDKYEEEKWVKHVEYEDPIKSSNFLLRMGGVGERRDNIPADVKGTTVGMETPSSQNLCGTQQTTRALSLLSAQSHNTSSQLLGTATMNSLINKSCHADSSPGHAPNHSTGIFEKVAQSGLHTPGVFSMEVDKVGPTTLSLSDGSTVDLQLPSDGISRAPNLSNTDYHHPFGRGIILDLLQLSSHLQRIEHQRHSTESEAG